MELVLTDAAVRRLARNPVVTREFPFLVPYGRSQKTCCGKAKFPDAGAAVAAIMNLPPDRKARFKILTGAESVSGQVVRAAKLVKVEF
jgi:hypothetical protein